MNKKVIPYGRQSLDAGDIRQVVKTLRSGWLTQGPMVARFEEAFAKYCGAPYAVAVSSGTAGLHLAALAAGIGPGDDAVTSPMTFVATANAYLYCGASVRFSDIDDSLCMDPAKLLKTVSRKTRAVTPVHFGGLPAQIPKFSKAVTVIEDACHALGARVRTDGRWRPVGDCSQSDMAVFSFHPVKHITTGEGGMITTRRRDLYEKLLRLRTHGIEKDPKRFTDKREAKNPWYYEMTTLGFNYRITDIQCALGLSQLKKIDAFIEKRCKIADIYDRAFSGAPLVRVPLRPEDRFSSYHLYTLRIDFRALSKTRAEVMRSLRQEGVGTQVHYIPVVRQPYYRHLGFRTETYPESERYYQQALSIPMYPGMSRADASRVVAALRRVLGRKAFHG